jgi:hypothetical protein
MIETFNQIQSASVIIESHEVIIVGEKPKVYYNIKVGIND